MFKKSRVLMIFLAIVTISPTTALSQERHMIEPFAGFSGIIAVAQPAFLLPGFLVGVQYEYNIANGPWIGARVGTGAVQPNPETAVTLNYAAAFVWDFLITDSLSMNVNVGMLPGIGVTLWNHHHIQVETLPIIFMSGGSVFVNVTYGYKFRL